MDTSGLQPADDAVRCCDAGKPTHQQGVDDVILRQVRESRRRRVHNGHGRLGKGAEGWLISLFVKIKPAQVLLISCVDLRLGR